MVFLNQCIKRALQVFQCNTTQTQCFQFCAFYCQAGCFQNTFVQMNQLTFVFAFDFLYMVDSLCNFDDDIRQGNYHQSCTNVKDCMDGTDLCLCNDLAAHSRVNNGKVYDCYDTEHNGTGNIKHQVHITNTFRCFCSTDTTDQSSYTSTDILTHDDIYCRIEGYQTRCRQGQQNTLGCRGTLDNGCYKSTSKNTQERVRSQCYKHGTESFRITQRFYGR